MEIIFELFGFIGLFLLIISYFKRESKWSNNLRNIGFCFMALHIIYEAGCGFYDGISGNSLK